MAGNPYICAMLQKLLIRNYAIIHQLELSLAPGLNIITGETGAGKSIIMGALGLVLGDRADTGVLHQTTEKCVVEALFAPTQSGALQAWLASQELDEEPTLTLRREIAPNGKSRSFINDTPATLAQMREAGTLVADLHRQFDTLDAGSASFQQQVLDALAGLGPTLKTYQQQYQQYTRLKTSLQKLEQQQKEATSQQDYQQFLYQELQALSLKPNELEQLETEQTLLENTEAIAQSLGQACYLLSQGEQPVLASIKQVLTSLQGLKAMPPGLPELVQRLQTLQVELKDISREAEALQDGLSLDEERLALVTERLNLGNKLLKKHGLQTTEQLLQLQQQLEQQLQQALDLEEAIAHTQAQLKEALAQLAQIGTQLTRGRQQVIPAFEKQIKTLLTQVGMPNARLAVQVQPSAEPGPNGYDEVSFLFDANNSGRLEPLQKVASGGELSRLMLSIKSLVARSLQMPTLIFDEIDSGISGEAARQVGFIMQGLAQHLQLIAITHQPQIAARAQAHYFVYKYAAQPQGNIVTAIKTLSQTERVEAIARMLSGNQLTETSLQIAREMMEAPATTAAG